MIKAGVIIENGQIRNICSYQNADVNEISLMIANLEIVKSDLLLRLTEIVKGTSNALSKKGSDNASHPEMVGEKSSPSNQKSKKEFFKKPKDIETCSDKQYNILKQADFDDEAIRLMSQEEIRKSIGYYLDNQKKENI